MTSRGALVHDLAPPAQRKVLILTKNLRFKKRITGQIYQTPKREGKSLEVLASSCELCPMGKMAEEAYTSNHNNLLFTANLGAS